MDHAPSSISELISKLGTLSEFAEAMGCKYETARGMSVRNSIAPEHWQKVIAASAAKGIVITEADLIAMRVRHRASKPRKQRKPKARARAA